MPTDTKLWPMNWPMKVKTLPVHYLIWSMPQMNAAATDVQSMPLPAKDLMCAGCTVPSRTALRNRHREKGMPINAMASMLLFCFCLVDWLIG